MLCMQGTSAKIAIYMIKYDKAKLPKVGIFFATQFPSQEIFTNKKVGNRTTQYTTFKTDMIKVILVLSISNSFTNKNTQGRKFSAV